MSKFQVDNKEIEAIKQDLRRSKALSESQIQAITTGEQLQRVLENEAIARKVSDANDEAFSAAFIERVDKQVEAEAFRRDQEEKNRKTARDGFEQDLDIIEEFAEKRIALNQKIIDSDEFSLEQKQKALLKNEELEKKLFKQSIDRVFAQGKASIEVRKDLTKAEKERRKALLTDENLRASAIEQARASIQATEDLTQVEKDRKKALLNTADTQTILNSLTETETLSLIKKLELGEIEVVRLKDAIKLNQDLAEARKESEKANKETDLKREELKKEIELQKSVLNGEKDKNGKLKDIETERLQDQKENLEKRIALLTKDSIKRLELEKQLNDLRLEEQEQANEKEEEEAENSAEKRAKIIEDATELATQIIEINNEKRLKAIDDQLSAVEERQSSLRTLAENGNEEAVKSLAESEKKEAEIRLAKEKELLRQQRIEAGLAAFKVFSANAEEDPKTALSKTIKDVSLLTAFIGALPSFLVGTEDTGKAGNSLDGNGGRLSILHDNERVITAKDNKKLGGISNSDLVDLATSPTQDFQNFATLDSKTNPVTIVQNPIDHEAKGLLKELVQATKRNKPVSTSQQFDENTHVLTQVMRAGNKIERTHKKLKLRTRNKS